MNLIKIKTIILLLVLVSISFSYSVFAEGEKVLFSGTVTGGDIAVGKDTANIVIVEGKVRVKYAGKTFVVLEGQCMQDSGIIVCSHDIHPQMDAYVSITASLASLAVDKVYNSKDYSVGDIINVKVNMKNTGKNTATAVKMVDEVADFTVINPKGCTYNGSNLVFESNYISSGSTAVCEYGLKVLKDGSYSRGVFVEYFDGIAANSASSGASFKVLPFGFTVKSSLDTKKLELGKANTVWFNLSLKSPKETKINSLKITFPDFLKAVPVGTTDSTEWTGIVGMGKSLYREFNVTVMSVGTGSVTVFMDYIAERPATQYQEYTLPISYNEPILTLRDYNFSKQDDSTAIYLKNTNNFDMTNIKLVLSSSKIKFAKTEYIFDKLGAGKEEKVDEMAFNAPAGVSNFFVDLSFNGGESLLKSSNAYSINVDTTQTFAKNTEKQVDTPVDNNTLVIVPEVGVKKGFWCSVLGWMIKSLC